MKTKAVRIYGKNDLRLDEVELPEIGADGVRIRVLRLHGDAEDVLVLAGTLCHLLPLGDLAHGV